MSVKLLDFDTYEETTGEELPIKEGSIEDFLMHNPNILLMAVRDQYANAAKDITSSIRKIRSVKSKAEELSFANDLATAANYINMAINKMV